MNNFRNVSRFARSLVLGVGAFVSDPDVPLVLLFVTPLVVICLPGQVEREVAGLAILWFAWFRCFVGLPPIWI